MGISKPSSHLSQLRRRDASTYTQVLENNATAGGYYASVTVGTPPQSVTLVIDTGSSDVWLLASSASLCTEADLQEEYGPCLTTCKSSFQLLHSTMDSAPSQGLCGRSRDMAHTQI
jgi:hypothetical protein